MNTPIFFSYLTGRNRTGSEPTGTLVHAVAGEPDLYPSFGKALCGAAPGRRSNGWSEVRAQQATCPHCIAKLAKVGWPVAWRKGEDWWSGPEVENGVVPSDATPIYRICVRPYGGTNEE